MRRTVSDMTIGQVADYGAIRSNLWAASRSSTPTFGPRGVLGDRLWAVRDLQRDVTASARQLPVLLTATARYLGPVPPDAGPGNVPEVEITFPDGTVLSSSDGGVHAKLSELAGRDVELTALPPAEDTSLHRLNREQRADVMSPASVRAAFGVSDGEKLPDLSMVRVSDLVTFARYSTPPGMFVDLAPVHVLSQTSLATIGAEIGSDLDVRRFRPNVLLALDDSDGRSCRSRAGPGRTLRSAKWFSTSPCRPFAASCPAARNPDSRSIARSPGRWPHERSGASGSTAGVESGGRVRIGDQVAVRPANVPRRFLGDAARRAKRFTFGLATGAVDRLSR